MIIEYRTISHPRIPKKDITFIFIDNKIDLPSSRFLTHEARYGGWHGGISGLQTHRTRAIKIGELYRHLDDMGLDWKNALEVDIKKIRNAMLQWDANDNKDDKDYDYKAISNDAMNQKIGVWYKFYKYMEHINIFTDMVMSTKWIKIRKKKGPLSHVDKKDSKHHNEIEVWSLRVKPSPEQRTFHALSRTEFEYFRQELEKIDKVFGIFAYVMVETGLRASATLQIEVDTFKSYFIHLNKGKDIGDTISLPYIAKGGVKKNTELRIRTIAIVQKEYLVRDHHKRMVLHSNRKHKGKSEYSEKSMWLLSNGRKVNYNDVQRAFKKASENMGRKITITSHWLRHTFATWSLMDFSQEHNIPLINTGIVPHPIFMIRLSDLMGHQSELTTMKYIATAVKIMKIVEHKGPIMPLLTLKKDIKIQELIKQEAKEEFGDSFNIKLFDVFEYARSRKLVQDDK